MKRILACAFLLGLASSAAGGESPLTFEEHVRPLLKTHCFQCHGEAGERDGELDLRLRRLIAAGGDSGPALVAGKPNESLLWQRISSAEMPPGDRAKLSPQEIDLIARWIRAGAATARPEPESIAGPLFTEEERGYWAFQPIKRPPPPQVSQPSLARNTIDLFLLARLERDGLSFGPEADRLTLLRRLYFDLLGLPPAPEEVAAFQADDSPQAYQRLVDRLLASPRYGERWGRHWLDVAGYADSEGFTEADTPREWAFRYRDYVVRSFNADLPFDQFIKEQLAGDELIGPPYDNLDAAAADKLTATGFLRMAPDGTGAGGVNQNEARNLVIADTIKVVSTSLLGLTVGCAECHDHRYDPIPQADYYRMRAIFEPALDWRNWRPPAARRISLYSDADRKVAAAINAEAAKVDAERLAKTQQYIDRTLEEELLLVEQSLREPLRDAYKKAPKDRSDAQKALLKEHPSVANISAGSLYLYDRRRDEKASKLDNQRKQKLTQVLADVQQQQLAAAPAEQRGPLQAALASPQPQRTEQQRRLLSQYALPVLEASLPQLAPEAAAELQRLAEEAQQLRSSKAADDLKRYTTRAEEIRARIPQEQFIRGLSETPGKIPPTFVFHRGDFEQPREQVEPGGLHVLPGGDDLKIAVNDPSLPTSGRRLAYANYLTSGRHPLTARVLVNRIWMHHFGRGIADNPGDFGQLGERPTHPQLLDWLASEFMAGGWSVKRIHYAIVTSAAYRQTSQRRAEHDALDPENRLYGRMSIRRLESEALRDVVLSVTGRLNEKMYGEPAPVMEDEVGQIIIGKENLDGERKPGKAIPLHGEEYRRSLYIQVRRSRPLSVLEAFDAPDMSPNCERRSFSNVTPQALMMMNSSFLVEASRRFAQRLLAEFPDPGDDRLIRAWALAVCRLPTAEQLAASRRFVQLQRETFAAQQGQPESANAELRALSSYCQALLSSNAFLYID